MERIAKDGMAKIADECSLPLAGGGVELAHDRHRPSSNELRRPLTALENRHKENRT